MNGVHATFQIPMAYYENKELNNTLCAYILSKEVEGIESNVAPNIKHNLVESKFNFLNGDTTTATGGAITSNFYTYT